MYALAFDLVVAEAERHHPVGATRAYHDIRDVLTGQFGFDWTQGSLYILRGRDGERLEVELSAGTAIDLAALAEAFWHQRT